MLLGFVSGEKWLPFGLEIVDGESRENFFHFLGSVLSILPGFCKLQVILGFRVGYDLYASLLVFVMVLLGNVIYL